MSYRAMAKVLGVSPSTIARDVAKQDKPLPDGRREVEVGPVMGLDGKVRPGRRVDTTQRDAEIRRLRASGFTVREVAARLGCSVGTVHRVAKS